MKTLPITIATAVMLAMASFTVTASPAKAQHGKFYLNNKQLNWKVVNHTKIVTNHRVANSAKVQPRNTRITHIHTVQKIAQQPNFAANKAIINADKAREAKELMEAQKMINSTQAHTITGLASAHKGQSSGGNPLTDYNLIKTPQTGPFSTLGNNDSTPPSSLPDAQDCIKNSKSCFHTQGNSTKKLGMFSNSVNLLDKPPENNNDSNNQTESTKTQQNNEESKKQDEEAKEISIEAVEQQQEMTTEASIDHNGGETGKEHEGDDDNSSPVMGDNGPDGATGPDTKPDKKPVDLTHTKDGQPDPNSGTVVGSTTTLIKNCIPGTGPCRKQHTTTYKDKISQPQPGDNTQNGDRTQSGGTNSTVAGKVMGFAVNPDPVGDNSQGGGGGGGQPVPPGRNASFGFAGNGRIPH